MQVVNVVGDFPSIHSDSVILRDSVYRLVLLCHFLMLVLPHRHDWSALPAVSSSSSSSSSPTIFPISSLILRVPRTSLSVDLNLHFSFLGLLEAKCIIGRASSIGKAAERTSTWQNKTLRGFWGFWTASQGQFGTRVIQSDPECSRSRFSVESRYFEV